MKKNETEKSDPQFSGHLFAVSLLEKLINFFKAILNIKLLDISIKWLDRLGHYGLIVAAFLGFLFALIVAIRVNSFRAFLYGIIWLLVVFVVQYTAHRFSKVGNTLINNNATKLSSKALLDCFAFLILIAGIILLILGIIQAIQSQDFDQFLIGFGLFILCEFVALIAFNPTTVSLNIVKDNSAGNEAIGIVTFFMKTIMRLVPIFFGVGIVLTTLVLGLNFLKVFGSQYQLGWNQANVTATYILMFGLLPFASYIAFVIYYLLIDIIRAILSIPEKLK